MRWQIKWAKNVVFSLIPFSGRVRQLKRRFQKYPTQVSRWTLEEGLLQVELLQEAKCDIRDATILEIGTGWKPVIPILFSLAGARRVVMVDTQMLMDADTFSATIRNLGPHAGLIATRLGLKEEQIRMELAECSGDLGNLLERFRLDYLAPYDITSAPLKQMDIDVVTSRAVLEHVPPDVLKRLLASAFALLRPGGWSCHAVDNSDHWSHNDRRLSRVNFLRYSDQVFGFINGLNPLDYQNRLRHSEYYALFQEIGFEVVIARSDPEPQALSALKTLPLAHRFRDFTAEDLARLDSYFLVRRPGSS